MRVRLRFTRQGWFKIERLCSGRWLLLGPFPTAEAARWNDGFWWAL